MNKNNRFLPLLFVIILLNGLIHIMGPTQHIYNIHLSIYTDLYLHQCENNHRPVHYTTLIWSGPRILVDIPLVEKPIPTAISCFKRSIQIFNTSPQIHLQPKSPNL